MATISAAGLDARYIAHQLGKATRCGKGWQCLCPVHNDHNPSFNVEDGDDGTCGM